MLQPLGSSYTRTRFIEDAAFQGPYYIAGKDVDNLPKELLEVSPLTTPQMKSTATSSQGTYRVTERESESKPSDKEPVQQLKDSSDPVSESVLSPLTGLSLIAEGKSREPDPGPHKPPKKEVDPFDAKFEDAPEAEEEELNKPEPEKEPSEPDPGSPILPDSPIPDPPTMASALTPTSLLGTCPTFKGKQKNAKEFITNIELYFDMNTQRINTPELKILLALQHISDDAQQWKENEKSDLDDATITDKQMDDRTGFKT